MLRTVMMLLGGVVLALVVDGCGVAMLPVTPVMPPPGGLYEDVSAPLVYDFNQTETGGKVGRSMTRHIGIPFYGIPIVSWEKASLEAAARAGGIKEVTYADYHVMSVLGCYTEFTVIAHGN